METQSKVEAMDKILQLKLRPYGYGSITVRFGFESGFKFAVLIRTQNVSLNDL